MNTRITKAFRKNTVLEISKAQKKLSLQLWVKLQHSRSDQRFNVLLTLSQEPDKQKIQQLQAMGLELTPFYKEQPAAKLPGIMTKANLEEKLLQCDFVRQVEGIPCL